MKFEKIMKNLFKSLVIILSIALIPGLQVKAEEQIKIVGSSTVFPFSTAVAEEFGRKTKYKTPIVESTGSGGGMKLFAQAMENNILILRTHRGE